MTNLISIFFTLIIFLLAYSQILLKSIKEIINSKHEILTVTNTHKQKILSQEVEKQSIKKYISDDTKKIKLLNSKQKIFSNINSKF